MASEGPGKPLSETLGLRPGLVAAVVDPPRDYRRIIGHLPFGLLFVPADATDLGFVHVFARERATLETRLGGVRDRIRADGMIWVSWPKKASGVVTDLTEDTVREVAARFGLVDVKKCAIDETWSGLKLVVPLPRRTGRRQAGGSSRRRSR